MIRRPYPEDSPENGPAGRERGFALLAVLWSVALLALLGARLVAGARAEAQLAAAWCATAEAEAAAASGVREAMFRLRAGGAPAEPGPGGLAFHSRIGTAEVAVVAASPRGLVNPNTAPPALLAALLEQTGLPPTAAAAALRALLSWRAAAPVQHLTELALLPGMDEAALAVLRPWLSLFNPGAVEAPLAPPAVRRALARSGAQQEAAGEDPGPLAEVSALASLPGGGRFLRRAVLRLEPPGVLDWEAGEE